MKYLFGILLIATMASCNVNSHIMLQDEEEFVYDSIPSLHPSEYVIACHDILTMHLFANDGFEIIDISTGQKEITGGSGGLFNEQNLLHYRIDSDSTIKLPIIGRVKLAGKSISDAEKSLEELYSKYYVRPFAKVNVVNRRVIVFSGGENQGKVVPLTENMTLVEVLAAAGGIGDNGRANSIKIIRNSNEGKKIFKVDLSSVSSLNLTGLIVQANDVVYVEPLKRTFSRAITEISPVITVLSTTLILYISFRSTL